MGTLARLVVYAAGASEARAAFERGFDRIRQLDELLSDYKPESEVSRLSTTPTRVSPELWTVLTHAQSVAARSQGAFDVTAGPVTLLWRQARRERRLPDPSSALARTGYRKLRLKDGKVWFAEPGMRVDLGGIAKGYAADEALKACGLRRAMAALSGDIALGAAPPGAKGWKVEFAGVTRELANAGVSTSGDSEQFLELNGVRYSHIVDPRTGWPVARRGTVSVVARSAMEADAAATAVSVLGVDRFRGVSVYWHRHGTRSGM